MSLLYPTWININLPVTANTVQLVWTGKNIYNAITFHSLFSFTSCSEYIKPIYTYMVYVNNILVLSKAVSSSLKYQSYSLSPTNSDDILDVYAVYNGAPITSFNVNSRLGLWTTQK